MANITVGLIPSPDMPHKIINKIYTDLPNEIRHHTGEMMNGTLKNTLLQL
ncbi:hypothetical protein ABGB00_03865 [Staphylococcus saprophyticus]|nr:hypothetical protein QA542_03510 [Staphylococcus saprophyticus]